MDKFAKFIESDAFFPVLVVLLILLVAAFLWVLIFNKNKNRSNKKKGDFVPASEDEIKFISDIPSPTSNFNETPVSSEVKAQEDFLFADVGTKLNTGYVSQTVDEGFSSREDIIIDDNVEPISNIIIENTTSDDSTKENNFINDVSIFDTKMEPTDDISINEDFLNLNIESQEIIDKNTNNENESLGSYSQNDGLQNSISEEINEDIFETENIDLNDDFDIAINEEEVALIEEVNNMNLDDDIPSAELIIEPSTDDYELPKSKDITAFEYEPTEDESINENVEIEMPREYTGEKTEIFEFPDFDNIDDIVNNESEDLEREIIEAANEYIRAIMER